MRGKRLGNGDGYLFVLALLTFCMVSVSGCGGGGGGASGSPNIALSSTGIDFGGAVLESFSDRSITVQNTGTANLAIAPIAQPSTPFEIVADSCSDNTLSPSESCAMMVRFSPTEQSAYAGSFNVSSNDGDKNTVTVNLSGIGTGLSVVINRIETDACSSQKLKLLVSVTDRSGAAVAGLQENNFWLFENGQEINLSSCVTHPPLPQLHASIGLVLDYSGSMTSETDDLEAATLTFLGLLDFPNDEAEIIKFDKDVYVIQAFTADEALLISAVNAEFPGQRIRTSLFDAVFKAIDDAASRSNSRLAVIAVTDGQDTESVNTLDGVIARAVEKGVPVFTISIGALDTEVLQRLASETSGQYFPSPTLSDLEDIYRRIAEVLSNQYLIEYTTGGGPVSLDLVVDDGLGMEGQDSRDAGGC